MKRTEIKHVNLTSRVKGRASFPVTDEILEKVKAETAAKRPGKLKIFLGYSAGVGKTYAMLEAARQRARDTDLVVALVETHGRTETEALLQGLEVLPRRQVNYRGVTLSEMDLDGTLVRHPQLALVDELAHTNAPGSRHPKRYEDVEELLDAGIDVYTTLNVQHIESLRNVVVQIAEVWVRETVPDRVIDEANEIELVDLPPDELLKRLKEGKVYVPEQAALATTEFFRKGNLTALRELTMRVGAERVDEQVRSYMEMHGIRGPWPTRERILVCVSPSSTGTRLVRAGRRISSQLDAEWCAVYVETPEDVRLTPDQRERLMSNMSLAERLGAKTMTLESDAIVPAIIQYAHENNFTKILVGRSERHRIRNLIGRSTADELIRRSTDVDVFVVATHRERAEEAGPRAHRPRNLRGYWQGLGLVVLATVLGQFVHQFFSPTNIMALYLLCVVVTAIAWGFGPSVLVATASVLALDFFFVPPYRTFVVAHTQYLFTLMVLLGVGLTISYLTSRVRQQTQAARRRESETATLYKLSRDMTVATGLEDTLHTIIENAKETFQHSMVVFLPDPDRPGKLRPHASGPGITIEANDLAAAQWSFEHQKTVGPGTDTLPNAKGVFMPLNAGRGPVGVLAIWMQDAAERLTSGQNRLLEAYADLAAVAIDRTRLAEEARNAQILAASDQLQTALLNSISHDLRTPLVSVIGVLSSLQEEDMGLGEEARKNLIQVAQDEAERLNRLITNLLDTSRIEAGAIKISRELVDVGDLIGVALGQLSARIGTRMIKTDAPASLPFVSVDYGLIVQVLVNVLDNALKYSPPDSAIEITARQLASNLEITVADRGIGIPPEDLTRVFDKFYRVHRPESVSGTGLGLTICKGVVEAHQGRIVAENRSGGGTMIRITLPIETPGREKVEAK